MNGPVGLTIGPDSTTHRKLCNLAAACQCSTFGSHNSFHLTSCSKRACDLKNVGSQFQFVDRKCQPPGYADTRDLGGAHQRLLISK